MQSFAIGPCPWLIRVRVLIIDKEYKQSLLACSTEGFPRSRMHAPRPHGTGDDVIIMQEPNRHVLEDCNVTISEATFNLRRVMRFPSIEGILPCEYMRTGSFSPITPAMLVK